MTDTMPTETELQRTVDMLRRELAARTTELAEARAERAATAEILEVINSSPADLTPVFEAILRNAHSLCGVAHGSLQILEDGYVYAVAIHGIAEALADILRQPRAVAEAPTVQALLQGQRYFQVNDVRESESPILQRTAELQGARTLLSVPLRREGKLLGIIVCARREVKPFTDRDISLLESFATQAVLAIENARLFNETQAKTHDLEEALRYQTGSANILNVIASSPTDVQPVLKAIVESACELCEANDAVVHLLEGDDVRYAAHHGPVAIGLQRRPVSRDFVAGRAIVDKMTIHLHDVLSDEGAEFPDAQRMSSQVGIRTILAVPMVAEGKVLGDIMLRRTEVRPFSDKQIALLQTFADQAVIALGNVHLFEEVQARTHDLKEALTYQTGSSNILRVIASSPTDVQPVLKAIVESACELCEAYDAVALLKESDQLLFSAHHGPIPMSFAKWPINRQWTAGRAFIDKTPVHVHDLLAEQQEFPDGLELAKSMGHRSIVSVPLLREGESIGALVLRRTEVNPFSDKQIALLQTFADQAVIAIGNVRLFEEVQAKTHDLEEALTYQTGSSNILRVIASSPTDVKPVLQAIVESACELCGAYDALVRLKDGDGLAFGAHHGPLPVSLESVPFTANSTAGLAMIERKPVHVHDLLSPDGDRFPHARELARSHGERTILSLPLLREDESIGAIILRSTEVNPFSDKQVALLQTFADQAVIALGNVRLFEEVQARTRDLQESLQQQTATADVLKVISRSAFDLQVVLDTLVESAARLCEADMSVITRQRGDTYFRAGSWGFAPEFMDYVKDLPIKPERATITGRTLLEGKVTHVHDTYTDPDYSFPEAQRLSGDPRTILGVPLLREGKPVGALALLRKNVRPFTDKQIELVTTFADQAVIAIENVRLFDEVQTKTHDLEEALRYQTGSANILNVIASSPTDVQPVLKAIVESACELCEAHDAVVLLKDGNDLCFSAHYGPIPINTERWPIDRSWASGRAVIDRATVHVHDIYADDAGDFTAGRELSRRAGSTAVRSILAAPLLREGESIGTILLRRQEVRPFNDKQIAMLQTFADQAVIALGNVRLFEEVQARTRDLSESLQQQTATADVLKVISRSAFDLKPVFSTIVQTASRLCEAEFALIYELHGDRYEIVAANNAAEAFVKHAADNPLPPGRGSLVGRTALERKPVHIPDCLADPEYLSMDYQAVGQYRTMLGVPLLREGQPIGIIGMQRTAVRPFTEKQIELVTTFADQAVIAIENVRLFEEVQARTRDLQESLQQQTATSEVLRVISSSPGDLAPVFSSMLENAVSICDAKFGNLFLVDGDTARWEAGVGTPPKLAEYFTQSKSFRPTPGSHLDRVMRTKQVSHTADDTAEAVIGAAARLGGARSTVCVPMVKDDALVGTIFIYRTEVRPFTDKQIDLVKNFAAQAVIAIENARLLKELRQRTDDLSASLDDLRAAQDRLVQTEKLASLGQLTAGIAHEIKNPLNFVNNFAALSVELTDELNDALKQTAIADKIRAEVDELTGLLKDNLAKVVQHGKRADSIVKNMLLHSREGSGEHRPADINALVDESLNLAYHGARAEKPQFNVTLQRNFDPEAGMVDVFPQEITRVFLNLLSNGFYAVAKRKSENGTGFEPTVSAMTKGRTDGVEIRIRDNGTGIPPEVKEKMFNPFFTTKPAGEGTGLGLSMSYDIVVKQHGGTIDVETVPEEFTEFTIVLPRISLSKKN